MRARTGRLHISLRRLPPAAILVCDPAFRTCTPLPQITSLEWSSSKLRGPHGPTHVLATGGLDGRVRLWAAPQKLV